MKRILMYTNDRIYTTERMTGGIKRFKMLYDGLIELGYNVTLYCGESERDLKKYNANAHSINREIKKSRFFPSIEIYFKNKKIIKKLKKDNYDEVIVFDVPTAIGLCFNHLKNINLFMRQDLIEYRKIKLNENKKNKIYSFFYIKFMSLCENICCRQSKTIILQCDYDLKNLLARHKLISNSIKKKAFIQINNVNAPWIVENSKIRIENEIKRNKFNICFIGDFSSNRKGHDIFLLAIEQLLKNSYNVNAYLIGDGKQLDEIKKKYKEYNNIFFLGRLKNPIQIIKQSNLVVVPSRADSCPNTVLESLYNNTLVIGSNAGGIPEILNNNDMLFDLNEESLYKKICELYNDKKYYDKLLKKQEKRKQELNFFWVKKIVDLLGWCDYEK